MKKKLLALLTVLAVVITTVFATGITTFASQAPIVSISVGKSYSAYEQIFNVSIDPNETTILNVAYANMDDGTTYGFEGLSGQIIIEESKPVNVMLAVTYDNGSGATTTYASASSSGTYYVRVYKVDENGNSLGNEFVEETPLSTYAESSKIFTPAIQSYGPYTDVNGTYFYKYAGTPIQLTFGDSAGYVKFNKVYEGAKTYSVEYRDTLDNIIKRDDAVINFGAAPVTVEAPASIDVDGDGNADYTLASTTKSYTFDFDSVKSDYVFIYKAVPSAEDRAYEILINLVDEEGAALYSFKQTVNVGSRARVVLPAAYTAGSKTYAFDADEAFPGGILEHIYDKAIAAEVARGASAGMEYTVKYRLSEEDLPDVVTIRFVDDSNKEYVLHSEQFTVAPGAEPLVYDIYAQGAYVIRQVDENGDYDYVEYYPIPGQGNGNGQIVHTYGSATRSYDVYYAAGEAADPEPYDVTLRYISVTDNKVLGEVTQTVKAGVDQNGNIKYESIEFLLTPDTLTVDGKDYIKLSGQVEPITHTYNDSQKTYAIFYRDASIDFTVAPVITKKVVIQYVTVYDGGVVANGDGTTVAVAQEVTTVATMNEQGEIISEMFNEEGNRVEFDENGQLVEIDSPDTPLENIQLDGAEGETGESGEAETEEPIVILPPASSLSTGAIVGIVIGAAVALAAIILLIILLAKKKNKKDEEKAE